MPSRLGVALLSVGALTAGVVMAFHASSAVEFAGYAAVYGASYLVLFPNPSGRGVTLFPAAAAAIALRSNGSPVMVIGPAALALPIGMMLVHLRFGRRVFDRVFPADTVGFAAFTAVFSVVVAGARLDVEKDAIGLLVLLVAAMAWFAVASLVRATWSQQRHSFPRRLLLTRAIGDWPGYAALMASAAIFEVTDEAVGPLWALVLAGLPYAFSHLSLHRVQTTRRTYRQTIEALGRVPEAGGLVAAGTAERVADLSVATAAEAGMVGRALDRLEFAALLHDIGRVVLANPKVAAAEYNERDVAGWSAAIISEARYLEPVAQIIAAGHEPYRQFGQERDPGVPLASQVVRAVSAYVGAVNGGLQPLEAVEVLHLGAAYDHDPQVVASLRRVLERRGVIAA